MNHKVRIKLNPSFNVKHPQVAMHFSDTVSPLKKGIELVVSKNNKPDRAPIIYQAILNNDVEMVKVLLRYGGVRMDVEVNGFTPLSLANALGNKRVISALSISHHANESAANLHDPRKFQRYYELKSDAGNGQNPTLSHRSSSSSRSRLYSNFRP